MATVDTSQYTRLYISPLNSALLSTIIPPSLQPSITNLSYHQVPTFPGNDYAYLELPPPDAQRIRNKLNGVTFKGMKLKVEEARPDKKRKRQEAERLAQEAEVDAESTRTKRVKKEKRKKEEGVFKGVELPDGREVKRGWTQPSEKDKKQKKSKKEKKDIDHKDQEMLFKTHLPANVASKTSEKGEKKKKERAGKGKPGRDTEVKEFMKTTKYPTFLRNGTGEKSAAKAVEFVDGKGWVDDEGNVVEDVVSTRSTRPRPVRSSALTPPEQVEGMKDEASEYEEDRVMDVLGNIDMDKDSGDDAGSLKHEVVEDSDDEETAVKASVHVTETRPVARDISIADVSVSEDENEDIESEDDHIKENETTVVSSPEAAEEGSDEEAAGKPQVEGENEHQENDGGDAEQANDNNDTIPLPAIAPTTEILAPAPRKEIHPLEALYKRQPTTTTITTSATTIATKTPTPSRPGRIETGFSFFNGSSDIEVDDAKQDEEASDIGAGVRDLVPPQTPFTQRDMEWRGMRSAAPTPDTAAISRRLRPWDGGTAGSDDDDDEELENDGQNKEDAVDDDDDEEEEEVEDVALDEPEPAKSSLLPTLLSTLAPAEQTEFEKHFWEMRGEYNRSWKQRKREARKEQRQSENRRTGFGK